MRILIGLLPLLAVLAACGGTAESVDASQHKSELDSVVLAKIRTGASDTEAFIDSLESVEAVSPQRIFYYRAWICQEQGQKQGAEVWARKALEGNALLQEDSAVFYQASDLLASTLANRGDYTASLKAAQRALNVSKEDRTENGRHWTAVLLHEKGYASMRLGYVEEAEQCYSMAYITLQQMVAANPKFFNLITCARVSYNILDAYISTGQYEKAEAWIEPAENAVAQLVASPECMPEEQDDYQGGLALQKAMVLLNTGHRAEADAAYDDVLQMNYANTSFGILERAAYLEKAKRWKELEELLPRIDSLSHAWGDPASLTHWKQYRKPHQ